MLRKEITPNVFEGKPNREIQSLGTTTKQQWDISRKTRLLVLKGMVEELGGRISRLEDLREPIFEFASPKFVSVLDSGEEFISLKGQEILEVAGMRGKEVVRHHRGKDSKFVELTNAFNGSEYYSNTNGSLYIHTPATLMSADRLLKSLTPGLDLAIDQNRSTVLDKTKGIESHLAIIDPSRDWIEFATIIPGMTIAYFFNDRNRAQRVVAVQANLSNGVAMPQEAK